jgi:hypothetical protein
MINDARVSKTKTSRISAMCDDDVKNRSRDEHVIRHLDTLHTHSPHLITPYYETKGTQVMFTCTVKVARVDLLILAACTCSSYLSLILLAIRIKAIRIESRDHGAGSLNHYDGRNIGQHRFYLVS